MTDFATKDRVFAKPLGTVKAFEFDEQVVRVFDDMISRSVPGYDLLLRLVALYADIFVTRGSRVYDLGCSTGLAARVIAHQVEDRDCQLVAVDNSAAMIDQCRRTHADLDVEWHCRNIEDIEIDNASLVVLNLTLQFIEPARRFALLQRVHRGLAAGGVLVLTEKVCFEDDATQQTMTELYQAFKRNRGYSELEISQKRSALENVLIPDSEQTHLQRLRDCGFEPVYVSFRCLNFISYLALRS